MSCRDRSPTGSQENCSAVLQATLTMARRSPGLSGSISIWRTISSDCFAMQQLHTGSANGLCYLSILPRTRTRGFSWAPAHLASEEQYACLRGYAKLMEHSGPCLRTRVRVASRQSRIIRNTAYPVSDYSTYRPHRELCLRTRWSFPIVQPELHTDPT
jgi:hypothetical protein